MATTAAPLSEKGYTTGTGTTGNWMTPDAVDEIPELVWPLNIAVFDRMRRQDPQVISVLRAVTLPIMRTTWAIDPAGARPEVAQMIADDLGLAVKGSPAQPSRTKNRFSWPDHLRHALLMLTFGHSFFEQIYSIDESGLYRLRKLGWRPPKTISNVEVAADGGLVAISQAAGGNTARESRMLVNRLVAYVNEREGGNWLGQSMLRAAYKFWFLKDRMLRTQAVAVDRNGLGVPVYTAPTLPDTITGTDRTVREQTMLDQGLTIAKRYRSGENAGAAIPGGATLALKGVDGQLPDADKPIRYYDEQIARSVLAHFLNLGTETGSWALGTTFADFFVLSLQTVAMQVADVTNAHVIEDWVDINFGTDEPAPRLVFDEIGARHPATADAVQRLIACGALTADEPLEGFLRATYGLPAHDPGTARQNPGTQAPPADQTADPNQKESVANA